MSKPKHPSNLTKQQQAQPQRQLVHTQQQWSGPLPPPGALAEFNQIIPNGAERIIAMVEQEQAHRIKFEITRIEATAKDTKRGHWIGGTISLAAIAGCVYTAIIGAHPAVSIALVSVPIATIVVAIVQGRSK